MSPIFNEGPSGLTALPNEIQLQVLYRCAESFSLREMMQVCFVNKAFYHMGMEAIYESDILQDAVYWDPVRGTKVFYEKIVEDEGYTYPCLLNGWTDTDDEDEDDYDYLPRYFRTNAPADDTEDEEELLTAITENQFVPSNDFWIRFLTARTLGKIRTKPPTEDHVVLKAIAERIMHYPGFYTSPCTATQEEAIRIVCEVAVKHGYIYDRRDFFIGEAPSRDTLKPLDEGCAVVRDGILGLAVYIGENGIFETVIRKQQAVTCPGHLDTDESSHGEIPPFAFPQVEMIARNLKYGFQPPNCGRSLIRLSNFIKLIVHSKNAPSALNCATIMLYSLSEETGDRDLFRHGIIILTGTAEMVHWLRWAIDIGPPLTKYNIILPDMQHQLEYFGRTDWASRSQAAIELSSILDKTKSLEVFDVVYDAIMAGYTEEEGVWWTKMTHRHNYAAHNIRSWGTARIHRAVLDDCMPIVKRLVELGYHLGPNHSAEDLEDEMTKTLVDSEKPRDISLQLAVSRGDMEMVQLLFQIGAERNRKNVRKAIWVAMEQDSCDILEVLMEKGHPDGLLNQRLKRIWTQKLKALGKEDMLPWVEKISGRQDELVFVHGR
jgi:hypothetical protein